MLNKDSGQLLSFLKRNAGGFALHEATLMSRIRQDADYGRGWTFCEDKRVVEGVL